MRGPLAARLTQAAVEREVRAVRLLVGGDDVNTRFEPLGIVAGDFRARRAIQQHGMRQIVDAHVLDKTLEIGGDRTLLVLRAPMSEVEAGIGQQHPLRPEQAANPQVHVELLAQAGALGSHLLQHHTAHGARSDEADRDGVRRKVQAGVHRSQCASGMAAINHHGDVALGRALRDGAHVHVRSTESVKHFS